MIRLAKKDEPAELTQNKDLWTRAFVADPTQRPYAHDSIRQTLREETQGKCAYCESRMEHVAPSNIEHIKPKASFPELVVEWTNLTLACTTCNTKKGTYYDAACEVVNPYVDEPSDHLVWAGPMLIEGTPDRGRLTITRLDLNRAPLLYERAQHLRRVSQLMDMIGGLPEAARVAIREDLKAAQESASEYSAAARAFVASRAGP